MVSFSTFSAFRGASGRILTLAGWCSKMRRLLLEFASEGNKSRRNRAVNIRKALYVYLQKAEPCPFNLFGLIRTQILRTVAMDMI